MAKTKFNMSAEEYFAERQAGKSIAQIAKEQDVSEATIYNYMNKWAEVDKVSGSVEDSPKMLREKDTAPATELKQLEKAVQEIERLTAEVERWKGQTTEAVALAGKAADEFMTKMELSRARADGAVAAREAAERDLVQMVEENDRLRDEINRMITERDELMAENDRLENQMVASRVEPQLADKPNEVQLLDRSIADLTRARWILNRLTASGE
ncbi:helix-turn-helix domain-containing protein [Paenibacillus ihuae]|uniref:helix-turn-helix domain-containing protein n=1 Tax=Paenibacillus ihuae TaxID=1232431 RepID=UPI001FD78799|nr:helix-turn-helix domain-containing protein [Paenibacillus ihuae]